MVGKNTLIINQEEMVRAMNLYFKALIEQSDHRGIDNRGETRVISVKQVGAQKDKPFVLELDDPAKTKKG